MERRRYRRKQRIAAALRQDQVEASEELRQTGGKISINSIPAQERRPTSTAPLAGSHSVSFWRSLYDTCRFAVNCHQSERMLEAPRNSTVVGPEAQGIRVVDHVLLSVTTVIQGTPVRTLVDSGATRSFIDERLQLRPPLHFVGAYSSLEMANGDTIVSTGIAPAVLVSIGPVQCRMNLTAVPLMRGFDVVLGKDWLDVVNPLIEWRQNTIYIKQGDQLHILSGDPNVQPCGIKDQGLTGLQDNFSRLHDTATTNLNFGKWGELFAQLASPKFWEYKASTQQWTHSSPRKVEQPQGEVGAVTPAVFSSDQLDTGALKAKSSETESIQNEDQHSTEHQPRKSVQYQCRKVAGRLVRSPVKEKLDFISLR